MFKILIAEKIADEGIAYLKNLPLSLTVDYSMSREMLLQEIGNYDALIVRSVTKVDERLYACARQLKVVGRAGNGTDNIDLDGATKRGIIVVNTPDANTVSAAEHTIALLLSLCRHIPLANAHIKGGIWDRSPFRGVEMMGKTLGIVGLGRIGSLVASRMKAFDMDVIAFDPYISHKKFEDLGVTRVEVLSDLVKVSDFISVHTPKTKETTGLINAEHFKVCKPNLRVVNCARGGIIDEPALHDALTTGLLAGAAIDVLKDEPQPISPLLELSQTVITPHLGADTDEAQSNVGKSVAEAVYEALQGRLVTNAVNLPALDSLQLQRHLPYLKLAETLGNLFHQVNKKPIKRVDFVFGGAAQHLKSDLLVSSVIKGLLQDVIDGQVNYVNAKYLADERGIDLYEAFEGHKDSHGNRIGIKCYTDDGSIKLEGTVTSAQEAKVISIDDYSFDLTANGNMLLIENLDRPGMIGRIGQLLGESDINISHMNVSIKPQSDVALMLLKTDRAANKDTLSLIKNTPGIQNVWRIIL